ncbi:FKBP-type peptidyl-prolyl cis-trans isomerase [Solicola sp. PLA-1-18]|uniref:FKBP-type peptidyl-prolyl cis-trans isomerase n=1 Tax=Solicola sp. PLA-1-18 TaxID=3380532 RepID=UPI003B7D46BC
MRRLLACLTVLVLALTACGGGGDGGGSGDGIDGVKVTGAFGKTPKVTTGKDFSVTSTESKVLDEGDGAAVKEGDSLSLDFVGVNGRTGKEFGSSFSQGGEPLSTTLTAESLVPGFVKGLEGKKIGSRVLVAIPAKDGFPDGNEQIGLNKTDTMVWVFDLVSKIEPKAATGTIADVKVTGAEGKAPKVEVKKDFYVDKTESKVTREGDGAVVKAGDTINVNYVGINGRDLKEFDSSYTRGQAADFTLAEGQLIPGFITGLVGKKVGDRVVITIPPADGYGVQGNSQAGIQGTDTLVFVVDILKIG